MITTAFIKLWDKRIGAIAWNPDTGLATFEYDLLFEDKKLDISPIKMPIWNSEKKIFSFPELRDSHTFKGLPGLLADVLPDKYGNSLINAWLLRNGRKSDSLNPIEVLCFIGKRGVGALEFEPAEKGINEVASKLELESLIKVAEEVLLERRNFKSKMEKKDERALLNVLKIGTSAGGARAKAVVAFNPATNELRSGQADAPAGFSHWLIKFDGVKDKQIGISSGYGRVEMAYHLMAKDAQIDMMPCRLLEENGRAHFMTRRFDRKKSGAKIHVQSFCALRHFDFNEVSLFSYEQLFETMRMLALSYPNAEQLFRRMVFNVMSRNCDDHTKNFSFLMDKDGIWKLAPAYDLCHAYRPGSEWVSQHALSINGKRKNFKREDFLLLAKQMNIKKPEQIIAQISKVVSNWERYADKVKVEKKLMRAIGKTLLSF